LTKGRIAAAHGRYFLYSIMDRYFPPQNCHFPYGIWTVRESLGPPESTTQRESRSVQPFMQGSQSWETDRPCYIGNNRPHDHQD